MPTSSTLRPFIASSAKKYWSTVWPAGTLVSVCPATATASSPTPLEVVLCAIHRSSWRDVWPVLTHILVSHARRAPTSSTTPNAWNVPASCSTASTAPPVRPVLPARTTTSSAPASASSAVTPSPTVLNAETRTLARVAWTNSTSTTKANVLCAVLPCWTVSSAWKRISARNALMGTIPPPVSAWAVGTASRSVQSARMGMFAPNARSTMGLIRVRLAACAPALSRGANCVPTLLLARSARRATNSKTASARLEAGAPIL